MSSIPHLQAIQGTRGEDGAGVAGGVLLALRAPLRVVHGLRREASAPKAARLAPVWMGKRWENLEKLGKIRGKSRRNTAMVEW